MTNNVNEIVERIAKLNDSFRKSILTPIPEQKLGQIFCTASIMALPKEDVLLIAEKVSLFEDFNESNDPYNEHDFGSFTFKENKVYWKIDYKDPELEYNFNDNSDPMRQNRLLTIMFSYEW